MRYVLSPQARDSLTSIRAYTLKNQGARQVKIYLKLLRDKMREAAKNPYDAGKSRDEVEQGYYAIAAGKHHIYYRIHDTHIDIIDVLHQRMEPSNHL